MSDEPVFYLTAAQWRRLIEASQVNAELLRDGAEVEVVDVPDLDPPAQAITFYATKENVPAGWPYPILESDTHGHRRTYIGDAQRDTDGRVILQVWLKEAVEQLLADYEGGVTDLDEPALEPKVNEVAAGCEADRKWIVAEFQALLKTCEVQPSSSPV